LDVEVGNAGGLACEVQVAEGARGGETSEVGPHALDKVVEVVAYEGDAQQLFCHVDGGGMEDATHLTVGIILSNLQGAEKGGLVDIRESDLESVGEDGEDEGVEEGPPSGEGETSNGVAKDTQADDSAASMVGQCFSVSVPVECGHEEDPEVLEDRGRSNDQGEGVGEGDREGGGGTLVGRVAAQWVKEHKFHFVGVRDKAKGVEPGEDFRDCVGEVRSSSSICGARGINGTIVDVE